MSSGGVVQEPVTEEAKPKAPENDTKEGSESPPGAEDPDEKNPDNVEAASPPSPQSQHLSNQQAAAYYPQLTPGAGYYSGYGPSQMTPEPPSPAGPGGTGSYDVAGFLQQQAAFAQSGVASNPFGPNVHYGIPQPPLSPSTSSRSMGGIPPASPLFPRATTNTAGIPATALDQQHVDSSGLPRMAAPPSPSVYLSPPLGPSAGSTYTTMYGGYGGTYVNAGVNGVNPNHSPEESNATWAERAQQNNAQASPQVQPGMPVQYQVGRGNRAYSFDEMLPPSMLDPQEQQSPLTYSPYGATQTASSGTLFAQQPWGFSPTSDMYAVPGSPLQPRPNPNAMQGQFPGAPPGGMRGVYPGQQPGMPPYYPASSPGPPIQFTASNKGPEGANLFIFHIPNHFTNLDMYHLFQQYGNLLSVRIMVEKETGRSRGFGFVSYDNPESASMAIKELNGFAIGNKRLKVQHKQQNRGSDRPSDLSDSLPPSNRWYDSQRPDAQAPSHDSTDAPLDDGGDQTLGVPEDKTSQDPVPQDAANTPPELPLGPAASSTLSPLGNIDAMRNALPEVSE